MSEPGENFPGSTVQHGTHGGWRKHNLMKDPPCEPCKKAKSEFDKETRRNKNKDLYSLAGKRARAQLMRNHPYEYRELYEQFKDDIRKETP